MFLLVVGPSASGKTTAVDVLRARGWAVFDEDAEHPGLFSSAAPQPDRIAIALDPSRDAPIAAVAEDLQRVRAAGRLLRVLALDADDTTLLFRLARMGRPPALADYGMEDIQFAIERERLAGLVRNADLSLDTSSLSPEALQRAVLSLVDLPQLG